jgi:hypothetical protein
MTTKQIAEAVGKTDRSVRNWIEKVCAENSSVYMENSSVCNSIRLKAGNKDPHNPADYTLEETLAIIEAGMGPDAAGIFRANASPPRLQARPVTGAYLRELNAAYDKSIIGRDDWRRMAGLDAAPEAAGKRLALPLLEERTRGLEFYQGIAEAGGLVNTDRDDIEAMYRRGRQ